MLCKGPVNIEKPCVPFFNKTKHNQAYKHVSELRENVFQFFNLLCTRGSLITRFTNMDIDMDINMYYNTYLHQMKC